MARVGLPAIAPVEGPLAIDVVYPRDRASIPTRDSTFIFGNVGTGGAQLRINGENVPVEPNGAFLAFLPVPQDGVYRLEATRAGQTVTAERQVQIPPPPAIATPGARSVILASSMSPSGTQALQRGEPLQISMRGSSGGRATLVLQTGERVPLVEGASSGGLSTYRATIPAQPITTRDTSVRQPRVGSTEIAMETAAGTAAAAAARGDTTRTTAAAPTPGNAYFELIVGTDTVRTAVAANIAVIDPIRPVVAVANDPNPAGGDNDGYVVGRPAPGTTSHYFWPNGTEFWVTGERAGELRVQLTDQLSAWINANELRVLPTGTSRPVSAVNNVSITADSGWIDVRFPVSRRLPFQVEEGERSVAVTLYGGTSATDWLIYGPRESLIERAWWEQPRDEVYRLNIDLNGALWGYQTFWDERGRLVLRLRKPPVINAERPLRGLTVTLDPGHGPPEGRFGPTRLTEAQANLDIALRLRDLIQAEGGTVQMTRTDSSAVGLYERPAMATRADAHLFVSIHNNAVGDGVNPFTNHGTSTYFFHTNSAGLARTIQDELVDEFRLPDLGYIRASLAVVRWPTWFPAVLTETMFFIMPDQEAALRNPEVLDRIARAHLRGIEAFLRASTANR